MILNHGNKVIKKGTMKSIVDISCENYVLHVFQGNLSPYDILLKYSSNRSKQPRTPKHIHWTVDLLLKKENDPKLTTSFLFLIKDIWNSCSIINDNSYETIKSLVNDLCDRYSIKKYEKLNNYGEYPVEFLFVLMSLLAVQEKTNATHNGTKAFMFGKIIDELLKEQIDIFRIMSTAGFGGRR